MCNLFGENEPRGAGAQIRAVGQPHGSLRAVAGQLSRTHGADHQAECRWRARAGVAQLGLRAAAFWLCAETRDTRDDKVQPKFWKDSFEKRRCLVPARARSNPSPIFRSLNHCSDSIIEGRSRRSWPHFAMTSDSCVMM